jgi:hypothetical protein
MKTEALNASGMDDLDLSLIRGGPFYRAQQSSGLIRPNEWNNVRRLTCAIAVGWLPLVLITLLSNPAGLSSLMKDYRIYSRLFIAVPVLLVGQSLMESRFHTVVCHIIDANLLGAADRMRMNGMITLLHRLRDSIFPEILILFLVVLHTLVSSKALVDATPWLAYGVEPTLRLTPAGWYAILVSATMFQFLLGLGLWKWLLWTIFAFQLSRLDLDLYATHPDDHGGLGFLGLTPVAFAPVSFAAASVIGATWRHELLRHEANIVALRLPAIVLVIITALIAFGPLAFFIPRLNELRQRGILEYGVLGQIHSAEFDNRWIRHRSGRETGFLTAPEITALSDYGRSFEKLERLSPLPADKVAFITLAASLVVPMLPVILAVVPLTIILESLLKALR